MVQNEQMSMRENSEGRERNANGGKGDEKQIKRYYVRILEIAQYRDGIIGPEYDGNPDYRMFLYKQSRNPEGCVSSEKG